MRLKIPKNLLNKIITFTVTTTKKLSPYLQPLLFTLILFIFLFAVIQHANIVNLDRDNDQNAYIYAAKKIHESDNYWHLGDRNRMPIYNYILALFINDQLTDDEAFQQGKLVNIFLTAAICLALYFVLKNYFSKLTASVLTLISTFTVFIIRAPYIQSEALFYVLSFLAFLLLCRLIKKPNLQNAILAGMTVALAYLTKATIMIALYLFLLIIAFQLISPFLSRFSSKKWLNIFLPSPTLARRGQWGGTKKIIITTVGTLVTFLLIASPYLLENKKQFGHYFYNVNTNFYMWYDSWEECLTGTGAHGDMLHWPDVPDEEIPSGLKYIKEHSIRQIVSRFTNGITDYYQIFFIRTPYNRYGPIIIKYLVIYAIFLLFKAITNIKPYKKYLKDNLFLILFVSLYFISSLLLFAWYSPIALGFRFILGIYLPIFFSIIYLIKQSPSKNIEIKSKKNTILKISDFQLIHLLALFFLICDGYYILTDILVKYFLIG